MARERLLKVYRLLVDVSVREEYVCGLFLGLVAREPVLLVGPSGVGRDRLVRLLAQMLGARMFRYSLVRFAGFDDIFGAVDVFKKPPRRMWSRIIDADIVFITNVFRASSAIYNALLEMVETGKVYDPVTGDEAEVKMWILVGTTKPEELRKEIVQEFAELYETFPIRVYENYMDYMRLEKALESRWDSITDTGQTASMDDVKTLHEFAEKLLAARVKRLGSPIYKIYHETVVPVVLELRRRGIIVSDDMVVEKLPKIYSAYLALFGVSMENLVVATPKILSYLATSEKQFLEIRDAINRALGDFSKLVELTEKLNNIKKLMRNGEYDKALQLLEEVLEKDVKTIVANPLLTQRAKEIAREAQEYLARLKEHKENVRRW